MKSDEPRADESIRPTEALATYVVNGTYEDLAPHVVAAIKSSVRDGLAVGLAGSVEPVGQKIQAFVKDLGGRPQSSVLGGGFRTSPPHAALANGTMIHALDYDDGLQVFSFHFTSVLLPPILALGEPKGISGKEAITAFAFGLEVAAALFRCATRRDYDAGWHRTSTVGTLAAAAAGAKVLGLDIRQTRMALGIAASQAAGSRQNFGTMTKPLHSGMAGRNGVTAAMMAQRDFTADLGVLEGKLGFCKLYFGDGQYDLEKIIASLSRPFEYVSSIRIKKYPCCGQNTRPIDAMLSLIHEYDLRPEQVDRIECYVDPSVLNILVHASPKTGLEGKFSLEFCLATALLLRRVTLDQFTDERVNDPVVQSLIAKISKHPDPTVPHSGGKGPTVTVYLADGRVLSRRIDMAEGQPWPPTTVAEEIVKSRDCMSRVLTAERTEAVLGLLEHLEDVSDVGQIASLVRGSQVGDGRRRGAAR